MKRNVLATVFGVAMASFVLSAPAMAQDKADTKVATAEVAAKPVLKYGVSALGYKFDADAILNTYKKITPTSEDPKAKDVFFLDREHDAANLKRDIEAVTGDFKGELGLAVVSKDGLVLLQNNSFFPLLNTINFDIVYAAASRMSARKESILTEVKFHREDLKSDIFSPMYERLVTEGFADLHSNAKVKDPKATTEYSAYMVDLMYYAVALNDQNACDLILNKYLKGPKDLEQFLKDKGLMYTKVNGSKGDIKNDTQKNFGNSAPLFDTAYTYVKYMQDTSLNVELRDLLDQATLETSMVKRKANTKDESRYFKDDRDELQQVSDKLIMKAVRAAIQNDSEADQKTLRVYLKSSVATDSDNKHLIGINDASFIVYKNEPYIVLASAKNMYNEDPKKSFTTASQAISDSIELVFKYIQNRNKMAARDEVGTANAADKAAAAAAAKPATLEIKPENPDVGHTVVVRQ